MLLIGGLELVLTHVNKLLRLVYTVSNKDHSVKNELIKELAELLQQQKQISMQREFAKYSKLQRKINQISGRLSQLKENLNFSFTQIVWKCKIFIYVIYGLSMLTLQYFYLYEPVYVLPEGWFPFISRALQIPTAVKGGIGLPIWCLICRQVLKVIVN